MCACGNDSHRSWQKKRKKVRSKKVRSVIDVTYCLIHSKAIFKKLLIYSRVSGWSDDVKVKASRYVVSSRRGGVIW